MSTTDISRLRAAAELVDLLTADRVEALTYLASLASHVLPPPRPFGTFDPPHDRYRLALDTIERFAIVVERLGGRGDDRPPAG